jgi:hypothetical protein
MFIDYTSWLILPRIPMVWNADENIDTLIRPVLPAYIVKTAAG